MTSELHVPQNTLSPRRRLAFTLILIVFPISIIFMSAELYLRVTKQYDNLWVLTGRESGRNLMEEWALVDAFSAYKGRPGHYGETQKTVNGYGFISTPEMAVKKPENTIRVIFLGGSSTSGQGHDLADKDTWPFKVAEILRTKFPDKNIEFINAALGGYTTFESFGRLWSRVRFFSPDIIVVYHGWNEMYYFNKVDEILSWKTLSDGSWGFHDAPKITVYEPYWIDHLLRYSQLLTKVRLRLSTINNGEVGGSNKLMTSYDKRALDIFRTNLRLIKAAASTFNAKFFVAKQATLIAPNLSEDDSKRCHYEYHGFDRDAHLDAFKQIYRVIDEEIDSRQVIDVTPLSGRPDYFYDHIHPTELGSSQIAEIVAGALALQFADPHQALAP